MMGGAEVAAGVREQREEAAVPVLELPRSLTPHLGTVCPSENCPPSRYVMGVGLQLCSSCRVRRVRHAVERAD